MALERRTYTRPPGHCKPFLGWHAPVSRQVAVVSLEALYVSTRGAATGADLGGSSKYSNESFED